VLALERGRPYATHELGNEELSMPWRTPLAPHQTSSSRLVPLSGVTSPAKRFMIFLMHASGSACGPVCADTMPHKMPGYGRICLILLPTTAMKDSSDFTALLRLQPERERERESYTMYTHSTQKHNMYDSVHISTMGRSTAGAKTPRAVMHRLQHDPSHVV
jgi:hypothetical protein